MIRPIDGNALYEKFMADEKEMEEPVAQMFAIGAANDVKNAPTIDVIPVNYIKEVYRRYSYEVADYLCSKCSNDHKENVFEHVFITNIRAKTLYDLLEGYKKETKNEQI